MANFFFTCFKAVEKDVIAFTIVALGFGCTCLFQAIHSKVRSSRSRKPQAADIAKRLAPAASDWETSGFGFSLAAEFSSASSHSSSRANNLPAAPLVIELLRINASFSEDPTKDGQILAHYEGEILAAGYEGDLSSEPIAERAVINASLRLHREDVLRRILTAPRDGGCQLQIAVLRTLCSEQRIQDARRVFDLCPMKTSYHYNTLLDAYIFAKDLGSAEQLMVAASAASVASVVTYNTIIKAFVQSGDHVKVRRAIESMRSSGLEPNCVTFNEMLDASIRGSGGMANTWRIVDEMQASGVKPNHVTGSIILKLIQHGMRSSDMNRAMAIVDSIVDEMDEVLLGSVIEACIRVSRDDFLRRVLNRQRSDRRVMINSSHTFGSLIRAFGYVRDVCGVWSTWNEMHRRNISWTSITLGNMVEALVQNSNTDAAYDLIRKAHASDHTSQLVNAVIYGSVLKGYSNQRQFDCVWRVHREMLAVPHVKFTLVTYNTLINACVRCREMERIASILSEMAAREIEPDTITYSAIIKGYCHEGHMDKAFELMDRMNEATTKYKPDEVTYNSLIDGCARQSLWDRGISLLEQMQTAGVPPSNFTLSVLVKLASRCKRLDQAFEICEVISTSYGFQLNVHVYNNLVQACLFNSSVRHSLEVFCQMVKQGVRPDLRTYRLLLSGSVRANEPHVAGGLLRAALGLPKLHHCISSCDGSLLKLVGGLPSDVIVETLEGISGKCRSESLSVMLLMELRRVPGLNLDSKPSVRLAAHAMHSS